MAFTNANNTNVASTATSAEFIKAEYWLNYGVTVATKVEGKTTPVEGKFYTDNTFRGFPLDSNIKKLKSLKNYTLSSEQSKGMDIAQRIQAVVLERVAALQPGETFVRPLRLIPAKYAVNRGLELQQGEFLCECQVFYRTKGETEGPIVSAYQDETAEDLI